MKKVICINDKKLPIGADIVEGGEYNVVDSFVNSYDQVVYILTGATNEGRTQYGLPWIGYSSVRFATVDAVEEKEINYNYQLN